MEISFLIIFKIMGFVAILFMLPFVLATLRMF